MEHAKRLVIIFDLAERCHELVAELKQLGANAEFVANNPAGLRASFNDAGGAGADIFLMHCESQYLAVIVANLRSLIPYCGIATISTLHDPVQRAELLRVGADAHFSESVSALELIAMQQSVQRRAESFMDSQAGKAKQTQDNELDDEQASYWIVRDNGWTLVSPEGVVLKLTYGEKFFIELLHTSADNRVSREQLMSSKVSATENSRAVDSLISRLRRKALDAGVDLPIKSVHGWGYSFAGKFIGTTSKQDVGISEFNAPALMENLAPSALLINEIVESHKQNAGRIPDELVLMFQAKLNVKTGVEDTVEAQLHWRLKNDSLIRLNATNCANLDEFVEQWLYESAFQTLCNELKSWASDYQLRIPVVLGIPLAVLGRTYQSFIRSLMTLGLHDGSVEIAITDYDLAATNHATPEMLRVLAALGVPVWLDNYVGTSENLAYLERWKLHGVCLSFDQSQSTLSNVQRKSLIMMTSKLCASLGLKTTITNVSSAADRMELQDVNADYLHGDFISLPLSRDGLLLAMASSSKSPSARSRYEYNN